MSDFPKCQCKDPGPGPNWCETCGRNLPEKRQPIDVIAYWRKQVAGPRTHNVKWDDKDVLRLVQILLEAFDKTFEENKRCAICGQAAGNCQDAHCDGSYCGFCFRGENHEGSQCDV